MTFAVFMSNRLINWLIFILLCFVWGSSFILMKESRRGLTGVQIASLRIFSAGLVFLPFAFYYVTKIPRKKLGLVLLTGVFGNLFPAFCFAIAIFKIDSSLAGILNSLTPICVVTIGAIFFKDKIKTRKLVGVLVGFAGLCILSLSQNGISLANFDYALLILAATVSYGINVNQVSHHLKGINPIQLAIVSLGFMSIPAGIILWQQDFFQLDFSDPDVADATVYSVMLGIAASSIATVLFYILVKRASGLFASLVTYGIPFVALFWGIIFDEPVTAIRLVSLCIILLGVYLANLSDKKNPVKEVDDQHKGR
jgi:drug/metabolite transporter (DMT)-like permease